MNKPFVEPTASHNVAIIVVTYNSAATIASCLESVFRTMRQHDELVIVDNSSLDATLAILHSFKQNFPYHNCKVISNSDNKGFSIATNQGIASSTAPFIILLNPDTIVTLNWLEHLLFYFSDDLTGAVGPVSNFAAGRQSVAHHWHGDLPRTISPQDGAEYLYIHNRGKTENTGLLIGFCLALRRDLLENLGALDERLILGNDDLELSWRLRIHGLQLKIATDVFVYHEGQHSFETQPKSVISAKVQESTDALYRILQDHYGKGRVPTPQELWNIDWFRPSSSVFNTEVAADQLLTLPIAVAAPTADNRSLVSIIILTFNQRGHTEACFRSIEKHTPQPHEIIVIDNGSTDKTRQWLVETAANDSRYRIILNNTNLGFSAGCNQGLSHGSGEFLVLLNNDVIVTPDWLSGLIECYRSEPQAGIVGPLTNSASGIQGLGPQSYSDIAALDKFASDFRLIHRYRRVRSRRLVGFCMLFHRSLYDAIGGLDERFGTGNYEDDDFCLRAAIAGFTNVIAADVFIHHHGSATFAVSEMDYAASLAGNRALFREKWSAPVVDRSQSERIDLCRAQEDADLLLLEEKSEEAVSLLESSLKRHPEDKPLQSVLCRGYECAGDYTEALLFSMDTPRQMALQASFLIESGRYGETEALLKSAIASDKGFGPAYIELGCCNLFKGNLEYGRALILKGIGLDPTYCRIDQALRLLNDLIDSINLLDIFQDARHLYPDSRQVARILVEQLALYSTPEETLGAAEQFLARFSADDKVIRHALNVRRKSGPWFPDASSGRMVSLCMIVKDEERTIAQCLLSCRPVVHEIIVVDTGSTDRTAAIAEIFGARIFQYPWDNDFAKARNYSLSVASGDWILVMDADEKISPQDYEIFKAQYDRNQHPCAFSMLTRNYTINSSLDDFVPLDEVFPEQQAGRGWTPSRKIRLFPSRREICFEGMVHETVEARVNELRIPVIDHPVPVHHYGTLNNDRMARKREIYYTLGRLKLNSESTPQALYELAIQAAELKRYDEAEELWFRFLETESGNPVAWFNLGYIYLKMRRSKDALTATEKALSLKHDYPAAVANAALCRFAIFPVDHAIPAIRNALSIAPYNLGTRILEPLSCCLMGQLDICIARLHELVAEGCKVGEFIRETALLLESETRRDEAEVLFALSNLFV